MPGIKFAYALNGWRPTYDSFVRREEHARALKTISVSGFRAIELTCGAGRWEPLGNREMMEANHGSIGGFVDFFRSCAIDAVSSYFFDPGVFLSAGGKCAFSQSWVTPEQLGSSTSPARRRKSPCR